MTGEQIKTIRAPKNAQRPYVSTARCNPQNRQLSFEARGVLWYLLSKPDDWELQPKDLEQKGCGRDKVYRILKELIEAGHLVREEIRNSKGKITGYVYQVYEISILTENPQNPLPEKPYTAQPYTGNQDITDKRKNNELENQQNKDIAPSGAKSFTDLIKAFLDESKAVVVNAYGNKTIRAQAKALWDAGITAQDVTDYVHELMLDKFWLKKGVKFYDVANAIVGWKGESLPKERETTMIDGVEFTVEDIDLGYDPQLPNGVD